MHTMYNELIAAREAETLLFIIFAVILTWLSIKAVIELFTVPKNCKCSFWFTCDPCSKRMAEIDEELRKVGL